MSTLAEIEASLYGLSREELRHMEEVLRRLQEPEFSGPDIGELERRNGFHPLPARAGGAVPTEIVRRLC